MSRKKLAVCGCSFSSVATPEQHRGTHFSEIMARTLDWDLLALAYQGCSNGGIRLQMQGAIDAGADFVMVIPTFFDRIEIPTTGMKPVFNPTLWLSFDQKMKKNLGYDPEKGMDNINHTHSKQPSLICENLVSLVYNWKHAYRNRKQLDEQVVEAVKQYVSHLYDPMWKLQQDRWIIEQGMLTLVRRQRPCFMIPTLSLWPAGGQGPELLDQQYWTQDLDLCPFDYSLRPEYSVAADNWSKDPGYHTTYEAQEIMAEKYLELMQTKGII